MLWLDELDSPMGSEISKFVSTTSKVFASCE